MKNVLWYIVFGILMIVEIGILLAICINAVLPIVMVLTRHGFWWLCLYLCLPLWMAAYIWLNNLIEDM
jgi:hypothetical protein